MPSCKKPAIHALREGLGLCSWVTRFEARTSGDPSTFVPGLHRVFRSRGTAEPASLALPTLVSLHPSIRHQDHADTNFRKAPQVPSSQQNAMGAEDDNLREACE